MNITEQPGDLQAQLERRNSLLEASENRFRKIIETMADAIVVVDREGVVRFVNPAAEALLLRDQQRLLGETFGFPLAGGATTEIDVIRGDGRPVAAEMRVVETEWDGETAYIAALRDITERNRVEAPLREANRLAALIDVASGVARKLNDPLKSVLGATQILMKEDLPKKTVERFQKLHSDVLQAAKIAQSLLSLSRDHEPEKQYVDVSDIVERVAELKLHHWTTRGIKASIEMPESLPRTMVDEYQFIEVVLNILSNAEEGLQEVGRKGRIEIRGSSSGDRVNLSISDNGPGISPENLENIFNPFFTTKEAGTRVGLGLSISRDMIRHHRGELRVESTQGSGATFHIELPVVHPDQVPKVTGPGAAGPSVPTKRILVVDDEPSDLDFLESVLSAEGHTVDRAISGLEALRKIVDGVYDCMLVDLRMPGMGGPQLYGLIERYDKDVAKRVIFLVERSLGSESQQFLAAVGNPVARKPFDAGELCGLVTGVPHGTSAAE